MSHVLPTLVCHNNIMFRYFNLSHNDCAGEFFILLHVPSFHSKFESALYLVSLMNEAFVHKCSLCLAKLPL